VTEAINKPIIILAIESSCDDTGVGIIKDGHMLANITYGQIVHQQYGGVIPEEASRQHMQNLMPVVQAALDKAQIHLTQLSAIAFTQQPGLIGSLLVGCAFAKSLAQALDIPIIAVHHMEAHVLSNLLAVPTPEFPFICLTVSGGHTQIVLANSPYNLQVLGNTIDDAAGEAFDKTAKMLGLTYPGGPLIDKFAQQGNSKAFKFVEPQAPELNFSFSGLKTNILYFLQKQKSVDSQFVENNLADICASVQYTIINILLKKLKKAVKHTGVNRVCIAGGVSANSGLRQAITQFGIENKCSTYLPAFEYCTDNGGMIAITAYYKYLQQQFASMDAVPSAVA
jgi:N6-L-threonylcarbamoyladenine synthase